MQMVYRCHAPLRAGRDVRVLGSTEKDSASLTMLLVGEEDGRTTVLLTVRMESLEDSKWLEHDESHPG